MGQTTAVLRSLLMHISCASSRATARHLCPVKFMVNPDNPKLMKSSSEPQPGGVVLFGNNIPCRMLQAWEPFAPS